MTTLDKALQIELENIVGPAHLRGDAESLAHYGRDWTRAIDPAPLAVVLPGSIEEVQSIVRLAAERGLAIVPSGGRTGLSAGAVAARGELVLALDRLDTISDFCAVDRTVRCGAGVVTGRLQAFAEEQGLFYPVDFASSGSSQIGGNIATNAGGIKVIRHGMTRDWVAGLKVVTGTGELLELNRGLIKNNAGYDLRHLMIGSEGTLGLIVEALISLREPPDDLAVMVLGAPDMPAIMRVLNAFRADLELHAFEFFSEEALAKVLEHQGLQRPFATTCPYYALLEFAGGDEPTLERAMALFESAVENGWVLDGTISQSVAQARTLWRLREDISETISRWTPYKNDISTIVSQVPAFLEEVEEVVNANYPDFEIIWFGHIGDGNVHLNILKPDGMPMSEFQARCGEVSRWVFEIVQRYGGSVSAEHGVGLLKKDHLAFSPLIGGDRDHAADQAGVRPGGHHESGEDFRPLAMLLLERRPRLPGLDSVGARSVGPSLNTAASAPLMRSRYDTSISASNVITSILLPGTTSLPPPPRSGPRAGQTLAEPCAAKDGRARAARDGELACSAGA